MRRSDAAKPARSDELRYLFAEQTKTKKTKRELLEHSLKRRVFVVAAVDLEAKKNTIKRNYYLFKSNVDSN